MSIYRGKVPVSKIGLIFFNFVVLMSGVGLIIWGFTLPHTSEKLKLSQFKEGNLVHLSNDIIIAGIIVSIFGFTGWYAALAESRFLLLLYSGVVMLSIIGGFVTLGVVFSTSEKTRNEYITNGTAFTFNNYHNTTDYSTAVDVIQSWFECCGTVNKDTPWKNNKKPETCHRIINNKIDRSEDYKIGCTPTLIEFTKREKNTFLLTTIFVVVIQVITLLSITNMISKIQSKKNYSRFI